MSQELQQYLRGNGIATSRTTPYNPTGNGQVERYNAIIWKTILLALKSKNLEVEHWETVLPSALHSIRTLLSTATNTTPHERFLQHPRRNMYGAPMPSWLANSNSRVLLKRHVRPSKYDPLVDEVELLEANHQYAHIRHPDGRESTVSTQHLAPIGESTSDFRVPCQLTQPSTDGFLSLGNHQPTDPQSGLDGNAPESKQTTSETANSNHSQSDLASPDDSVLTLRRSSRQRRAPERYGHGLSF